MGKVKRIIFAFITVILSLVVTDLLLNAAAIVSPRVNEVLSVVAKYIPDERLGHRPNPAYPDHDEYGFRNQRVPETAHVVTLGDSQTYGNGVEAEQAWPAVLEARTGRSVYNMAFGGYGPVHSLMLWDQASTLKPEVVIEGLYSGNDLYDAYQMIYERGKLPELKSDNQSLMDDIAQAKEAELKIRGTSKTSENGGITPGFRRWRKSVKSWFTEHSKIYALLWRTKYELSRIRKKKDDDDRWQRAKSSAAKHPEKSQIFSSNSSRTIFTSEYRLRWLNLDDPRVREGQRVALEAIRRLHQLASRDGIRFVVLLIPTKELVFSEQAKEISAPSYLALLRNERQFWKEAKSFLAEHSIEYVDSLQSLRTELETGIQPYRVTSNGHPNEHGYGAIARAIHSYLDPDQRQ